MSDKTYGVEEQIIEWENWDQFDGACFGFYPATLKVDLDPFKKGDVFECVTFDFDESEVRFSRVGGEEVRYRMNLSLERVE